MNWFKLRYKLANWAFHKWLQLRDLRMRLSGYRLLHINKGDHNCVVYLNGASKLEPDVFEAKVPEAPGVWGYGWVHKHKMEHKMDGSRYVLESGKPIDYYVHGQVMWRESE